MIHRASGLLELPLSTLSPHPTPRAPLKGRKLCHPPGQTSLAGMSEPGPRESPENVLGERDQVRSGEAETEGQGAPRKRHLEYRQREEGGGRRGEQEEGSEPGDKRRRES